LKIERYRCAVVQQRQRLARKEVQGRCGEADVPRDMVREQTLVGDGHPKELEGEEQRQDCTPYRATTVMEYCQKFIPAINTGVT
jgi:hypothetical protein